MIATHTSTTRNLRCFLCCYENFSKGLKCSIVRRHQQVPTPATRKQSSKEKFRYFISVFLCAGYFQWEATADVILNYDEHIPNLHTGTAYQIRVVSKNGAEDEAAAEWQEFVTLGVGKVPSGVSDQMI